MIRILILMLFISSASAESFRIGVDPNLKPFAYSTNMGEIIGFDIDVAKQICIEIKKNCEFISVDWDGLIPSLLSGKIDAIISGMSITEDRSKVVSFSNPYYKTKSQLVALVGQNELKNGDRIGVLRGSSDEGYARNKLNHLTLITYDNQNSAFLDLASGRLSAVLGPRIELESGLEDFKPTIDHIFLGPLLDDPLYYGPGIGIAIKKNQPKLLTDLNNSIEKIYDDGRWQSISDFYFDIDIWAYPNRVREIHE